MFVEDEEAALVSSTDLVHSHNEFIIVLAVFIVHHLCCLKPIPNWDNLLTQAVHHTLLLIHCSYL